MEASRFSSHATDQGPAIEDRFSLDDEDQTFVPPIELERRRVAQLIAAESAQLKPAAELENQAIDELLAIAESSTSNQQLDSPHPVNLRIPQADRDSISAPELEGLFKEIQEDPPAANPQHSSVHEKAA